MNVLVTGGAGYVGSHAVKHLTAAGHQVWVYDNLSTGHRQAVPEGRLIQGDLLDAKTLTQALGDLKIDAVMHFAAKALVGESVQYPDLYYQANIAASVQLVRSAIGQGIRKFVFSSTTAVYGNPEQVPIDEQTPRRPVNPYGFTKYVVETLLEECHRAYGLAFASLRYFNAAGAALDGTLGEDHEPETHLIPVTLQVALGKRDHVVIYGTDYPTADGTCIRDYVHVEDLARAHVLALDRLKEGSAWFLNLGSGHGYSVRQVIQMCRQVTGHPIPAVEGARRPGDPPVLVARIAHARSILDWEPQSSDLKTIVQTAWNWHRHHPNGFGQDSTQGGGAC